MSNSNLNDSGRHVDSLRVSGSGAMSEEASTSPNGPADRLWDLVRQQVLVPIRATMNFKTLRDMYNDVVLDSTRLKFVDRLGEGNYGKVDKYLYKEEDGSETFVAVKRLKTGVVNAQGILEFMREVKLLKKLGHSRIATFRGTGSLPSEQEGEEDDVFLAEELLEGGSLRQLLEKQMRNPEDKLYTMSEGVQWLTDVARGLAYLHGAEPQVIHRDLKLENIMLTKADRRAKLVDFGLHKVIDKWEKEYGQEEDGLYSMTGGTGSFVYMPPEAFLGPRYNHKVDVFAFAIIAWELMHYTMLITRVSLTGSPAEIKNYAKYVATEDYRPALSNVLPKAIVALICDCWKRDPNDRPEFDEVVLRLKAIAAEVMEKERAEIVQPNARSAFSFLDMTTPVNKENRNGCCCWIWS